VAEASAISRAPKTMSRGTFFSRASTSTSITSSRFPVTTSSQFRYQAGALDILERQPHRLSFELHAHLPALCTAQHAHEPAPPAVRRLHVDQLVSQPGHRRLHHRFKRCHGRVIAGAANKKWAEAHLLTRCR